MIGQESAFKNEHEKFTKKFSEKKWKEVLLQMIDRLMRKGLPYLIYLHAYRYLDDIIVEIKKSQLIYVEFGELYRIIEVLCPFMFWGLMDRESNCMKNLLRLQEDPKYLGVLEEKPKPILKINGDIKNLLKELCEIKQKNLKGEELPELIKKVMSFPTKDPYEEVCLNWVKEQLDRIRSDENKICCKCLFRKGEPIKAQENMTQEFKRYIWPIKASNIITHIKKTIVGFLNAGGGIIYVGIYEDSNKVNSVVGIALKTSQLEEVYRFFQYEIVDHIYPKHKRFQIIKDIVHNQWDSCPFYINEYISMELLPLVDGKEYYNYQCQKPDEKLFIIKLVVRVGHPKHLYHIINNEQSIDFYVRQDRNVEKKPFPEAHSALYERLENFDKQILSGNPKFPINQFHANCQYHMQYLPEQEDTEYIID